MKFNKKIVTVIMATSIVLIGAAAAVSVTSGEKYESSLAVEDVTIKMASGKEHVLELEIAEKPIDIQVGLMHRKEMGKNHGMLFKLGLKPRVATFWMRNTFIPLDMLFVDENGKIVNIHPNAVPQSLDKISSEKPVIAVIELNGGRAAEIGIQPGDQVVYSYFR